ncbi:MAG: DNA repair protein RadA [Vulcanimicrobiaceae bacterium]
MAKTRAVAKARSVFFCSACGFESPRWLGRCPQCDAWNSFDQTPMRVASGRPSSAAATLGSAAEPVRLRDIDGSRVTRERTGMTEFDAVLGGGIVPGSLVLIGGPPGAGKSTLVLQMAARLCGRGAGVVYVCGEESAAQLKMRASRLSLGEDPALRQARGGDGFGDVLVYAETNLRAVLERLERLAPKALIVDSIQTMWLPEAEAYAGSVTQIRDCTQALVEYSKRTGCATFVIGHITKDGTIAGPRLLEHLVDTVLYFEGENTADYRILRAYKNRFGSIDEICVFSMHGDGLHEIANPSELFLSGRAARSSGSCVVASIVGSRPLLVEVQALVGETSYGSPRRLANNLDQGRLAMILAVLERRAGMQLGTHDVYVSVAGGLRVNEPAADLGIALAIASSFRNRAMAADAVAFGEVGLSGEIRAVGASSRRCAEARKLGYGTIYSPENCTEIAAAVELALG